MKKLLIFIISVVALFGCKPDFDPSDDFKEVDVVYGVINPDLVKNYLSVGRGFQTNGESALDLANSKDSIYHSDSITVELIEFEGSEVSRSTQFKKETFYNREDGVFINPEHDLFVTDSNDFAIKDNKKYRVKVTNTVSGKTTYSDVKTLETFRFLDIFNGGLNLSFYSKEEVQDQTIKVTNANGNFTIFETTLILPYVTKDKDNNIVDTDTLIFNVANGKFANAGGQTEFSISGESLINKVITEIPSITDNNHKREFGIITMNSRCYSEEMYEYVLAEQSFNSLSQSKPFFSNVYNLETNETESGVVATVKEINSVVFLANSTVQYISSQKPSLGFPQ